MSLLNRILKTFRQADQSDEIAEEIAFHREEMQKSLEAQGLTPEEARRRVALRFGGAARLREESRNAHIVPALEAWIREVRLAVRSLAKRPVMTVTAIASLGAGIGATAALFSVADAVFLKPLPLPEPASLYALQAYRPSGLSGGNPARLHDLASVDSIAAATGYYGENVVWTENAAKSQVSVLRVFEDFWGTVAVNPIKGRFFTSAECQGTEPVAVVSETFWRNRLGSRALPAQARLGPVDYTVVGVAPASLSFFGAVDVILPPSPGTTYGREAAFLGIVARLRPSATREYAQAQIDVRLRQLAAQYPATDAELKIQAVPLQQYNSQELRAPLTILLTAVAGLLLIACVNVSGLLLGRAIERSREAAIRRSLGAGTFAVLRLYVVEGLLLSLAGAVVGLLVALNLIGLLRAQVPASVSGTAAIVIDWRTAAFTVAIAIASGLLAAWAPAWHAGRTSKLAIQDRSATSSGSLAMRRLLAWTQLTLSVVLVAVSVLLARTFLESANSPVGITAKEAVMLSVDFPWDSDPATLRRFNTEAVTRLAALPRATGATFVDRLPLEGGAQTRPLSVRGNEAAASRESEQVSLRGVDSSAFQVLGWPIREGRPFRTPETKDDPREAVVSESFVRRYFAGQNPIGREINFEGKSDRPTWYQVVGVAADYRESAIERPLPQVFVSHRHVYWPLLRYVVTTQGPAASLAKAARGALLAIDAATPLEKVATLDEALRAPLDQPRVRLQLLTAFTALALGLAILGLYGLMTADVARRTREFGVRLALGASPEELIQGTAKSGVYLGAAATVAGLIGAFILLRVLGSILSPLPELDPGTVGAVAMVALTATALASWIPARRAARVDPMTALRQD